MANHVSNLDPQALIPEIPGRTSAFLKRSLMKIPIVGYGFRLGEFIPVDRKGSKASAQESVAAAQRVLDKGVHITTFVEGTRSKDGRMLPFKKGPFYLAMETGAPCIPVSIYGTETMMAKGSMRIKPGTAHIVFHAPVNPADLCDARGSFGGGTSSDCFGAAGVDAGLTILWLHDGVIAVVEQLLAHGVGVVAAGEWADLHVDQVVGGVAARGDGIAVFAQCASQNVGVLFVRDGGNLDHQSERGRGCRGRRRD